MAQIIQSARWDIGNTARCLAFCHARVLIEINGDRLDLLLVYDGKATDYVTDCETITVRVFRTCTATRCAFSLMSVTSHAKNMTTAEFAPLNVRYPTKSKHSPTWAQNRIDGRIPMKRRKFLTALGAAAANTTIAKPGDRAIQPADQMAFGGELAEIARYDLRRL